MPKAAKFKIRTVRRHNRADGVRYAWILYAGNGVAVSRSYRTYGTRPEAREGANIVNWIFNNAHVEIL